MKKIVIVVSAIVIVIIVGLFLPITQKSTVEISANFDNTALQIIHLDNWKNWFPEMREAYAKDSAAFTIVNDTSEKGYIISIPGKKYIVHAIAPMSYSVSRWEGGWKDNFAFNMFPENAPGEPKMQVTIVKKIPILLAAFNLNKAGDSAIGGLKSYLEDPKAFYGYEIEKSKIRDSIIATSTFRISKKDIFSTIHNATQKLVTYVQERNLVKTGNISVSYSSLVEDSLRLSVGIPVNKPAAPAENINCLELPPKGKLLIGFYEGKFADRVKIYRAMLKYMTDHMLNAPAEYFEGYLGDSLPTSDTSQIRIELNYPIY